MAKWKEYLSLGVGLKDLGGNIMKPGQHGESTHHQNRKEASFSDPFLIRVLKKPSVLLLSRDN